MRNALRIPGDEDIIRRILDGDVDAYELLLERYRDHVFGIVAAHVPGGEVGEVAHDVFVRAYQSLPSCKRRDRFRQWLSRIAVRTCCDFWRRRYRSREQPLSTLDEGVRSRLEESGALRHDSSFERERARGEARELLSWALDRLSPEDRMVLELIHIEERPVKEIAGLLGWSIANVKVRAFRSRRKLRAILGMLLADQGGT
jgi:RNA polymerase sigma-70 factor (ECF subfamily)